MKFKTTTKTTTLKKKAAGVYKRMLESMFEHTLYVLCCYVYVLYKFFSFFFNLS